jgi:hypothetical protein
VVNQQPSSHYIPGMCNIGPAERRLRRIAGFVGIGLTIALLTILIVIGAPRYVRLILVIPASTAAVGLLQDAFHFCAAYGIRGIYNVLNSAGITQNVEMEEYRRKDLRKTQQIVSLSLLIGLAFSVLTLLI